MSHPFLTGVPLPRVIAHRGLLTAELEASGAVENSLAAVDAAVAVGADIVESDCHVTADGVPILTHDVDLVRVVGDPRTVAEVSLRELRAVFADRGGLLTLREAFDRFPSTRFNIDIKAEAAVEPGGAILGEYGHRALIGSFSDSRRVRAVAAASAVAQRLHGSAAVAPATSAGTSVTARLLAAMALGRAGSGWAQRLLAPLDAVQLPERQSGVPVVTSRLITAAHRAGTEVHVWTVNDEPKMRELVGLGVDGIVTDRADLALRVFAGKRTS